MRPRILQDFNPFQKSERLQFHRHVWSFVVFFLAASASFSGFYSANQFHEAGTPTGYYQYGLEQMLAGTAERPYVYRQLLPMAANWADRVTPQSIKNLVNARQIGPNYHMFSALQSSPIAMNEQYSFRYLIFYLSTFMFALAATYGMYRVCLEVQVPPPAAVLAPMVLILLLPYIFAVIGFFYDYSELAFMAFAVWITARYRWRWVIPIAALAAWNKESFFFFVPMLYPFMRRRSSRTSSLTGIGLLCFVCGVIYLLLRARFAHNAGVTVYFQTSNHLNYLIHHPRFLLFTTEEAYGLRVPLFFSAIPLALVIWSVARVWKRLATEVRQHAKIAAAINLPLFILFCAPAEARDLSMLYISLLFVIAANLEDWFRSAGLWASEGVQAKQPGT
jgi:hypothetical protein